MGTCRLLAGFCVFSLLAVLASAEVRSGKHFCNCEETANPVCGSDQQTYGNACTANCAGVKVIKEGACECRKKRRPGACKCKGIGFEPVCAEGLTWKNRCEAECDGRMCGIDGVCPTADDKGWVPTPGGDKYSVKDAVNDVKLPNPKKPKHEYDKALHMALMLYEAHRTGDLPYHRFAWRGDSCFNCTGPAGEDLSKGYIEAGGSNLKILMASAFTVTRLAWAAKEFPDGFKASGNYDEVLDAIRWGAQFLIDSHPEPYRIVAMFGSINQDFGYFGPPEQKEAWAGGWGNICYATPKEPATESVAEAAAALAATSLVFKKIDKKFSKLCLKHAKQLYKFSTRYKKTYQYSSDKCIQSMGWLYPSKGYEDEIAWATSWMYAATGDKAYLKKARVLYRKFVAKHGSGFALTIGEKGPALHSLMMSLDPKYYEEYQENAQWLFKLYLDLEVAHTPKGLAYPFHWGACRAAANIGSLSLIHSKVMRDLDKAGKKIDLKYAARLFNYGKFQIDYLLGSSGRSWVTGFGKDYPTVLFHKASYNAHIEFPLAGDKTWVNSYKGECSIDKECPILVETAQLDFQGSRQPQRFIAYGHLFGAPLFNDGMVTSRKDYSYTEGTTEGQGGFLTGTAALADYYQEKMTKQTDCGLDLGWDHPNAKTKKKKILC
ncbi:hypothetical protein BSKO_07746 [Bryopsis sp. KO-2023]|nr:hypothetical protein BSKO_07746 [Bryopsis sp. KO-2023]